MFGKRSKCHEVVYITDYVQAYLKGEKPKKPNLEYSVHKYIFELFNKILEMGALNNTYLLKLVNESSLLSDFDINMSFISKELRKIAEQLAESSESNMAVVEIVEGVSMIADQTNLLSLNASIEAARAGESEKISHNSINVSHPMIKKEWDEIDESHMSLHKKAHEIIKVIEQGKQENAHKIFNEARQLSDKVISKLNIISEKLKLIDENIFGLKL